MYNVVNGKTLRLDQHSAAIIREGEPIFKIPTFGFDGGIIWRGCYGTPSTALAALKTYSDKKKLPEEKHKELVDIFTASIIRTDEKNTETKDVHVTITAAPPASMLRLFDGPLSMEDFYKRFDEKGIMKNIFAQKLPASEAEKQPLDGESIDIKGQSSDWYSYIIPHDGKCNNEFVSQLPNVRVQVPRNMWNVLSWMKEVFQTYTIASGDAKNIDTFAVIMNSDKKNVVAIGDPFEWHEGHFNNLASNLLNRQQVFGDVTFLSKNPPSYNKKKKQKKEKEITEPKSIELKGPEVPAATTTTTTTAAAPVKAEPKPKTEKRAAKPKAEKKEKKEKKEKPAKEPAKKKPKQT